MIKRYPTKQIFVGNVPIGGDAKIPVQVNQVICAGIFFCD